MSRIGKRPIKIEEGVEVEIKKIGNFIKIKARGPKGENEYTISHPGFKVEKDEKTNEIKIIPNYKNLEKLPVQIKALWGTYRAHINNLIKGVKDGFSKELEIKGLGYKAEIINGKDLKLFIGYSHPVIVECPEGIKFSVKKNIIKVEGIDKEKVGQVSAKIRKLREPDPYKHVGIKYVGEKLQKKLGKKLAAAK